MTALPSILAVAVVCVIVIIGVIAWMSDDGRDE
jgi:hypothetical protein